MQSVHQLNRQQVHKHYRRPMQYTTGWCGQAGADSWEARCIASGNILEKEQQWLELADYLIKHLALRRRLLADSMPA
jgi:hypothetical protein